MSRFFALFSNSLSFDVFVTLTKRVIFFSSKVLLNINFVTLKNRLLNARRWKRYLSSMKSLFFFSWIKQLIFCVNEQKTVHNDVESNLKLKNLKLKNERLKLKMKIMQQKLKRMKKKIDKKNIQLENQTLKMQLKKINNSFWTIISRMKSRKL